MVLVIASLCGLFVLGLVLLTWTLRHALKKYHQGIRPSRFMWQVERIGNFLISLSVWIAAISFGFFRLPITEQFWLSGLSLVSGVFLVVVVMTGIFQKFVNTIIVMLTRSSATSRAYAIAIGVNQVGLVMAFTSFGLLGFTLLVKMVSR